MCRLRLIGLNDNPHGRAKAARALHFLRSFLSLGLTPTNVAAPSSAGECTAYSLLGTGLNRGGPLCYMAWVTNQGGLSEGALRASGVLRGQLGRPPQR